MATIAIPRGAFAYKNHWEADLLHFDLNVTKLQNLASIVLHLCICAFVHIAIICVNELIIT